MLDAAEPNHADLAARLPRDAYYHLLRTLRLAQAPERALLLAMQCRTPASAMMRQAQSFLSLLLRMQAARRKTEHDSEAQDRAAAISRHALGLMQEALAALLPPPPHASPPPRDLPPPPPGDLPPPHRPLSFTEQDAAIEPRTAALIRRIRQSAGPPDDLLLQALITGLTPLPAKMHRQQHPEHYTD